MARASLTFRQRDVERAVKAARNAGIEIGRVEIAKDGRIAIVPAKEAEALPDVNEWDALLTEPAE